MYVTIDGPEGAGKSTLINKLVEELNSKGRSDIIPTREPGGTEVGEKIRDVFLDHYVNPHTETYLMLAQRAEHLSEVVRPALRKNQIVLSDRSYVSSVAMQGYGRKMGLENVEKLNTDLMSRLGVFPDFKFLLLIDPSEGLKRKIGSDTNRLDEETMIFHERCYQAYQALSTRQDFIVLDGTLTLDSLVRRVMSYIWEA